jgi:hypothetical protein
MLQFVVFDALMWKGQDIMKAPYADRIANLMAHGTEDRMIHVLPDRRVRSTNELVEAVRDAVANGHEGCVLKDPAAGYQCRRSRCVQKVKPRGPDINAGVTGVGFCLSGNPRRWGLLTCIRLSETVMVTYCKTEVLEGDNLCRAFQHVHRDLDSRVCVKDVLKQPRGNVLNTMHVLSKVCLGPMHPMH